jgi:hypothetical protein
MIVKHGKSDGITKRVSEIEACFVLKNKHIFASYNNPMDNADTERVIRTVKEGFVWNMGISITV